ncbi:MAG: hypothetical protein WCD13_09090, partial [Pseudolabrys sp.]
RWTTTTRPNAHTDNDDRCQSAIERRNFKTPRNPKIGIRPYKPGAFYELIEWKCVRSALETKCIF